MAEPQEAPLGLLPFIPVIPAAVASEATALNIRLFGPMKVYLGGVALPHLRSRRGLWLLALLALRAGRSVERSWLAGTLWPDSTEENSLVSLRQTLTDLRRALGPERERLLAPTSRTLCLDLGNSFVDVLTFDDALKRGDELSLAQAVVLHQKPLLEDCLEEWILPERQQREQACLSALERLAALALAQERWAQAAEWLRRVVAADPFREAVQRDLMTALARDGSPGDAIWVFREMRLLLQRELRMEPAAETRALYRKIRADARRSEPLPAPMPAVAPLPEERLLSASALPRPLTALVGREHDLEEIGVRLFQSRLVTLMGLGGVGKTRLAIQVAEDWAQDQPDGVWFVELAPVSDPGMVPAVVAGIFGLSEQVGVSVLETLSAALREKRLLLVLDNCEHLIDACVRAADFLLSRCPLLRIVATSRQALGVTGETTWAVAPLPLPPLGKSARPGVIADSPAVLLFVERAAAVQPGFALSAENAADIAEICCRLDGIPLALELAAARVRILSPKQITERLGDSLRLLGHGRRAGAARQQTLRALLDWSYDLLSEAERRLLNACSVFAGGWTLEAAEIVCRDDDKTAPDVLDGLMSLADKSLVQFSVEADSPRCRMLETVRQYAREALGEGAEAGDVSRRHCDWLRTLVAAAQPHFRGAAQADWLRRLEAEHDNLRAALDFCRRDSLGAGAELTLAADLWQFWMHHGHFAEGRERLTGALARAGDAAAPEVRLKALNGAAAMAWHQGDLPAARLWMEEALQVARQAPNHPHLDSCLHNLGNVLYSQGELAEARVLWEESLAIRRADGNLDGVASGLSNLGSLACQEGDFTRAEALHSEALQVADALHAPHKRRAGLVGLGQIRLAQEQYEIARVYLEEALMLAQDLDDRECLSGCLTKLGLLALRTGDLIRAGTLLRESIMVAQDAGMKPSLVAALEACADLLSASGSARSAVHLWKVAETQRNGLGLPRLRADRDHVERQLAGARRSLGSEAFELAWHEACSMALEDAMAALSLFPKSLMSSAG